jgi:hypothetical protein
MSEPYAESCSNMDECWTCPGCYTDFPLTTRRGLNTCANCRRRVNCTRETVPQYVATLVDASDTDGEDA